MTILYPRMWTRRKKGWGKKQARQGSDENAFRDDESFFMDRFRCKKLPLHLTEKPISVDSSNSFIQEIEEEIQKVKREEGERVNYMTFEMKMMEERKEGRAEGLAKGLAKGRQEERVAILRRLVMQSQIPIEQALAMIGIPSEEYPSYKKLLHAMP